MSVDRYALVRVNRWVGLNPTQRERTQDVYAANVLARERRWKHHRLVQNGYALLTRT